MNPQWRKWLSQPGNIRVVAVEATALVRELRVQQQLKGAAQAGYAEAVVGSLLIASGHKSSESINMNAQGSGVYGQAIIDASPEGRVRGFLIEQTDKSMHTYGAEGHNGPWGTGVLSILYTKNFEGKYPYTGMVPIHTGFLDEAINEYYRDSEQLVSKAGLFVEFDGEQIICARGALVQALGGAEPQEHEDIRALSIQDLRTLAKEAADLDAFAARASRLLKGRRLEEVETKPLTAFCNCSQERIERALELTGKTDILEALGQDETMSISCDFCRKEYKISAERVRSLFERDPTRLQ